MDGVRLRVQEDYSSSLLIPHSCLSKRFFHWIYKEISAIPLGTVYFKVGDKRVDQFIFCIQHILAEETRQLEDVLPVQPFPFHKGVHKMGIHLPDTWAVVSVYQAAIRIGGLQVPIQRPKKKANPVSIPKQGPGLLLEWWISENISKDMFIVACSRTSHIRLARYFTLSSALLVLQPIIFVWPSNNIPL